MQKQLISRSNNQCEISGSTENLVAYLVAPKAGNSADDYVYISQAILDQIEIDGEMDEALLRCLNDAIWSEVDAVKVVAWRLLNKMRGRGWTDDLLEMMYMEDDVAQWAKSGASISAEKHVDSNGVELQTGDSVTLIKDLKVKGGNFTAKRGTAVRNIRLVHDNPEQIEGKVEGQQIVILTEFVKK
jgi:protein PhnA